MTKFKKGDRVKVTFEAEVESTDLPGFGVGFKGERGATLEKWFGPRFIESTGLTVEKVEPPVEVFKPGALVRNKRNGKVYAIGVDTYIIIEGTGPYNGQWVYDRPGNKRREEFHSGDYERVDLSALTG